jgi:DNA-binding NarL/FixJ family response regulator
VLLGRVSDADRHFAAALKLADAGKAPVWRAQAERDLGKWRARGVVPDAAPPSRPDGLSGREVDVLRLIAAGRSNREIGEHLMISPNTAANHVRAILQKTACANRAEAAAYAARNDLLE